MTLRQDTNLDTGSCAGSSPARTAPHTSPASRIGLVCRSGSGTVTRQHSSDRTRHTLGGNTNKHLLKYYTLVGGTILHAHNQCTFRHAHHKTTHRLCGLRSQGRRILHTRGGGELFYMPISTEGSGTPTMRLETGLRSWGRRILHTTGRGNYFTCP